MASPETAVPDTGPLFEGEWTYRSYVNNADPAVQPNALLFGLANIVISEATDGSIVGSLGGDGWSLSIAGEARYLSGTATVKFQGTGMIGGEAWVYDYFGYYSPVWANAVNQIPALIGAVVRTAPHGSAPAGFAAQFIAIRKN